MKKIISIILILVIAGGAVWYWKRHGKTPAVPTTTTFRSENLGITFTYPKILSASTTAQEVTLHHEVAFEHHDFCDFKGEATTTIPTLTDLNVNFHVSEKNIVDTMKAESPYIPEENFVNGEVVPSPGFIDPYSEGDLKGFSIFEGAEGCGHTVYYIALSNTKTLVVKRDWITIFSGSIDVENKVAAEAVPGVINKEKETGFFDAIMASLKIQ